jgi:hypothetical protein
MVTKKQYTIGIFSIIVIATAFTIMIMSGGHIDYKNNHFKAFDVNNKTIFDSVYSVYTNNVLGTYAKYYYIDSRQNTDNVYLEQKIKFRNSNLTRFFYVRENTIKEGAKVSCPGNTCYLVVKYNGLKCTSISDNKCFIGTKTILDWSDAKDNIKVVKQYSTYLKITSHTLANEFYFDPKLIEDVVEDEKEIKDDFVDVKKISIKIKEDYDLVKPINLEMIDVKADLDDEVIVSKMISYFIKDKTIYFEFDTDKDYDIWQEGKDGERIEPLSYDVNGFNHLVSFNNDKTEYRVHIGKSSDIYVITVTGMSSWAGQSYMWLDNFARNSTNTTTVVPREGLVAFYPLNGNTNDYLGLNNGTEINTTNTTDRFENNNGAYNFEPSINSGIQNYNFSLLNNTNLFTVCGWFSTKSISLTQVIVSNYEGVNRFNINVGSSTIRARLGNKNVSSTTLSNNVWYHFCFVNNGPLDSNRALYLNSVIQTGTSATTTSSSDVGFWIGARQGGTNNNFNGSIDDVMIFNRSLSDSQVQALYQSSNKSVAQSYQTGALSTAFCIKDCINETGIVAQYRAENDNVNLNDYYGNYNFTVNGVVANNTGKYGYARGSFSETNFFSGSLPNINDTTNISFSFWLKLNYSTGIQTILDYTSGVNTQRIQIYKSTTDTIIFYMSKNGAVVGCGPATGALTLNNWYMFTGTYDGTTRNCKVYLNSNYIANENTAAYSANMANTVILGKAYDVGYSFSGYIDNLIIKNYTMPQSEINKLYLSGYDHYMNNSYLNKIEFDGDVNASCYFYNSNVTNFTTSYDNFFSNWTKYYTNNSNLTFISYANNQNINSNTDYGICTLNGTNFNVFNMTFYSDNSKIVINNTLLTVGNVQIQGIVEASIFTQTNATLKIYRPNGTLYNTTYNDTGAKDITLTNIYDYATLSSVENGTWSSVLNLTGNYNATVTSNFQVGYSCTIWDTWIYSGGSLVCNVLSVLKRFSMYDFNITMNRTEITTGTVVYLERSRLRK